ASRIGSQAMTHGMAKPARPARAASPADLFLGIDGGGSRTRAVVVAADGREQGRGSAEGANYRVLGVERAVANLWAAASAAVGQAGAALPAAGAWVGRAGVARATDPQLWLPRLIPRLARELRLTNDAELVLSAVQHAVGVAVISGTGSIALGRDPSGASARV